MTSGEGNEGAVSTIFFGAWPVITLPATRPSVVLRVTIEFDLESASQDQRASLRFEPRMLAGQSRVNQVTWEDSSRPLQTFAKSIDVRLGSESFSRGDSNADGRLDVSDSVYILNWLFTGGEQPSCLDAADVDDDGKIRLNDGHLINLYLFLGGVAPATPGPKVCGPDPVDDDLGCVEFEACNP